MKRIGISGAIIEAPTEDQIEDLTIEVTKSSIENLNVGPIESLID
jgi:hypothetical protein